MFRPGDSQSIFQTLSHGHLLQKIVPSPARNVKRTLQIDWYALHKVMHTVQFIPSNPSLDRVKRVLTLILETNKLILRI